MTRPRLLFTRPEDELERGRVAARQAGFELLPAPLLIIEELPFTPPHGPFDALLFTSPRAPSIVAGRAPALRALRCCAVGPRTAEAALAAGFDVVLTGDSDGVAIVRAAASRGIGRLLQPGGEDRIAIPAPEGLSLTPLAVYRARAAAALPDEAAQALADGMLLATLLFSPRSAGIFVRLLQRHGIDRAGLRLIALSANVASAAGPGWKAVATARLPTLAEALVAATDLWQKHRHG